MIKIGKIHWMKWNWPFFLGGTLLIASCGFLGIRALENTIRWADRIHERIQGLQKAQLAFSGAEESYAKYLLKKDGQIPKGLEEALAGDLQKLELFTWTEDPLPPESVSRLHGFAWLETDSIQKGVELTQRGKWAEATHEFQSQAHKDLEAAIRGVLMDMARLETWRIKVRMEADAVNGQKSRRTILIAASVMTLTCLLAGIWVFRHSKKRGLAERMTAENLERFRIVMETTADGVVLCDAKGDIRYFNRGAESIFGYSASGIIGKPFVQLLPDKLHRLYRDGLGDPSTGLSPRIETTGRRSDGTEFPMEVTSSTAKVGERVFHTRILRDISERRQAEAMLEEREETFRNLFEESPVGMALVDQNYRWSNVNYAFCHMLDQRRKELVGGGFQEHVNTEDKAREWELATKLFAGLILNYHLEKRFVTRAGKEIWCKVSASAIQGQDGKPKYMLAVIENIDEIKKMDEMKADLISVVSHQLKTPVGEINGYIENLLEGLAGDLKSRQREYLEDMREISHNNYRLISDLLNVSKIERGIIAMDIQPVAVGQMVQMAVRDYSLPARQKGLSLEVVGGLGPLKVLADRDKTVEVLRNLVNNALKCTDQGSIRVEILEEVDDVFIEVQDTGVGMSREKVTSLFTKQTMLGKESGRAGAGLGLFIAKNFMEMQNGEVAVRSELGKGTCFTLCLPKAKEKNGEGAEGISVDGTQAVWT